MLSTVRVGMVGAGAVAARHLRTLQAMEGVRVAGVADPALERARELAEAAGAAAYPNHMELLAAGRLDAVYICVPPFAHGAPELAVIDAGLPFFVEKPVAIDLGTAAGIAARLAERPLLTCTGYHWRWLDIYDRAAALLADRPARLVQCTWLDKVPPPPWWRRRDGSGGQTIEQTTHVLDVARGLAGEVSEVHAVTPAPGSAGPRTGRVADGEAEGSRLSTTLAEGDMPLAGADIDDVTVASLRFASGAVGSVVSSCLLPRLYRAGVRVVADGLTLELTETELVVEAGGERRAWAAEADARPRPDRDFIAAVRGGGGAIRVSWPEAYRTHLVACAISRSAEAGRPVPVAPVEGGGGGG